MTKNFSRWFRLFIGTALPSVLFPLLHQVVFSSALGRPLDGSTAKSAGVIFLLSFLIVALTATVPVMTGLLLTLLWLFCAAAEVGGFLSLAVVGKEFSLNECLEFIGSPKNITTIIGPRNMALGALLFLSVVFLMTGYCRLILKYHGRTRRSAREPVRSPTIAPVLSWTLIGGFIVFLGILGPQIAFLCWPDGLIDWQPGWITRWDPIYDARAWAEPGVARLVREVPVLRFSFGRDNKPHAGLASELADLKAEEEFDIERRSRGPSARKNIVIIVGDAARRDHLSVYGYGRQTTPFLDQLTSEGRLSPVGYTMSTCAETMCGLTSMLSSRLLPDAYSSRITLNHLLKKAGYRTVFYLRGFIQSDIERLNLADIDELIGGPDSGVGDELWDDAALIDRLARINPDAGQPTFLLIWLVASHQAGLHQEKYAQYQPAVRGLWRTRDGETSPETRQSYVNAYDNGILQLDAEIHEVVSILEQKGYLQDAVTVITADHGQGLGEHQSFGHLKWIYPEMTGVPLLIGDPSRPDFSTTRFAQQIDIAPTLLDLVGLPAPRSWTGLSLLKERREWGFSQDHLRDIWPFCRGVTRLRDDGLWSLMHCETDETPVDVAYELTGDPRGRVNRLQSMDPSLRAEMLQRMEQVFGWTVTLASPVGTK